MPLARATSPLLVPAPGRGRAASPRDAWPLWARGLVALLLYYALGMAVYIPTRSSWGGVKTAAAVDALYFCTVTLTTVGYGDVRCACDAGRQGAQ